MKQVNRRESHRVDIQLRCYVTSPASGTRSAMHIVNISRGGLLLAWRSEASSIPTPSMGQILTIEVELPANHGFGPKCIHCQGAVVRLSWEDEVGPRVALRLNYMDFRAFAGLTAQQSASPPAVNAWTA